MRKYLRWYGMTHGQTQNKIIIKNRAGTTGQKPDGHKYIYTLTTLQKLERDLNVGKQSGKAIETFS